MNPAISSLPTNAETETAAARSQRLPSWKDEINQRLSAHRSRREGTAEQASLPGMDRTEKARPETRAPGRPRAVAARVAERFAKAPSYEEMLAAARAAEAAAQASRQADEAAQAMLAGLEAPIEAPQIEPGPMIIVECDAPPESEVPGTSPSAPEHYSASYHQPLPERQAEPGGPRGPALVQPVISYAGDLMAEATVTPAQPLPAKLIEFPRELIASRKARPRRDEGPLLEEAAPQLRIFEVEPEAEKQPAIQPEWHSIRLDSGRPEAAAHTRMEPPTAAAFELPLKTAPMSDRLMAAIVDVALVLFAFLLFVLVFAACTAHPPLGKTALFGAGAALATLFVLYQWLFFSYAEATPGMRYARIALCTFDDENPGRRALRSRIAAFLLAALPLGLGFVWSFFDEDRLGWHDRMTRTYQRSYR